MKSSIKIIKRKEYEKLKQEEVPNELKTSEGEKSVERSTREMVSTVKSWIAELQRTEACSGPFVLPSACHCQRRRTRILRKAGEGGTKTVMVSQGLHRLPLHFLLHWNLRGGHGVPPLQFLGGVIWLKLP